ncbi:MAG: aminoglycoside phosphotransferase family protein [Ktedonobacteraceae bacterium]|nr:aminoglycoside phosphotransferase family protein [Ktedonobacteraceae bacterium]
MMINPLELAAKRTLAKIIEAEESLKPLYLQPDRAVFLAANAGIILKVYDEGRTLEKEYETAQKAAARGVPISEVLLFDATQPAVFAMKQVIGKPLSSEDKAAGREAGMYIERFHSIETAPPFSGGQMKWDEFILWWATLEIGRVERLDIFTSSEIARLKHTFHKSTLSLADRPIVLLHGDLQAEHILIDSETQKVLAFLDFADAQPGDPLLDIAIVSLWDTSLADILLEGYTGIENDEQTQELLWHYRLLRLLGEVPWLLNRGFKEYAEKDIKAMKDILQRKG